ncbi:hypothetical protein PHLGIDRAFT_490710 [Phlebiopsis gigantea 11061_1 CR5-6]|uniref:Uncharacterized protein n=1 Tax=Phlebiopsis gigantea (strain 11061_1 CR5-6) TaxID=745531 RepID=A0A0C3SEZ2_PHLG1|nr:hypothetical protein PHLGIDRAFT_490710 [Phlebiopsis gigantea 11061_1 CR5-6]
MIKDGEDSLHFFSTAEKSGDRFVPCKAPNFNMSCDNCRSPLFDETRGETPCSPIPVPYSRTAISH